MTADLGSRKIRDEISAMEVMAINPIHRLVTPRLWAASYRRRSSSCRWCSLAGLAGGFFFNVVVQHVTAGAYFPGFTALVQSADLCSAARQGVRVRVHRGDGRLLQGPLRQGRPEGRRRRGEPGRRHHLHPHLLRQLRHDVASTSPSCPRSSDGGRHARRGRRHADLRARTSAWSTASRRSGASSRSTARCMGEIVSCWCSGARYRSVSGQLMIATSPSAPAR